MAARAAFWPRAASTAIALDLFHRRHGRYPDRLDDLVPDFLPSVPVDPFDGRPVRFRHEPDRLIIYSIGGDGVDNGGLQESYRGPDFAFPVRLRLPASD